LSSSHAARLSALLDKTPRASPSDLKVALTRLTVETKERKIHGSPDASTFFSDTVRELRRIRGVANADLRITCLYDAAQYYHFSGYAQPAAHVAIELTSLARLAKLKEWERKGETVLGITQADLGNIPEAIIHYSKALEIAGECGDKLAQGVVLVNLGVALNYAGLFREAIPCFTKGIELAHEIQTDNPYLHHLNSNLAQSYLYIAEYETSLQHLQLAANLCRSAPASAEEALARAIVGVTGVQVCCELGSRQEAQEFRNMGQRAITWTHAPRSDLLVQIADGLYQVHFGDPNIGLAGLDRCYRDSKELRGVHFIALQALVKSHDTLGSAETARSYIDELMVGLRRSCQESVQTLMADVELSSHYRAEGSLKGFELKELRLRAEAAEAALLSSRVEILERLAIAADLREESSGEHGIRVGRLSFLLAQKMGLSFQECASIELGARLHDIGKVAVPDKILLSSAELKAEERGRMCVHAAAGAEILSRSTIPQLRLAEDIARFHHEWWNGHGYPSRLSGNRIPVAARIVAIADVFDAMTHGRPYAQRLSIDEAVREVSTLGGVQFDPALTQVFLELIASMRAHFSRLDEHLTTNIQSSPFVLARARIRRMLAAPQPSECARSEPVH